MDTDPIPNVNNTAQQYMCPICGEISQTSRGLSIHGAKTHNVQKLELYLLRFPNVQRSCACGANLQFIDQEHGFKKLCGACSRHEKTVGRPTWNAGLTKDSDERMAAAATGMRRHYAEHGHHRQGHNKLNDESVHTASAKISQKLKAHYVDHDHWSHGLSADTSDIVAKRTASITRTARSREWNFTAETRTLMRNAKLLQHADVQARLRECDCELVNAYVDMSTNADIRCLKCAKVFARSAGNVLFNNAKCPICHPPWASKTSRWQQEVYNFVLSISPDARLNDRTTLDGLELDIYVPSKKFGIECNGLYWHSGASGRFKHDHCERKRCAASAAGIAVLFLFEDEWTWKRTIVESMIKHRLCASEVRLDARKLTIDVCEARAVARFIDANHIDGHARATYAVKLTQADGTIVAACTLRTATHGSVKGSVEIARLCFALNTLVRGGVSRLISAARTLATRLGTERLTSYTDNRLGGKGYDSCMQHDGTTRSRFWWTDGAKRFDRFTFKADSGNGLSERDVAKVAGVSRIYGCSNERWVIKLR